MLEFFRKYQRIFFIFVTIVIIVSFSFFGTYSAMGSSESEKEIVVGRAIDGSKLKYSEIKHLAQLLGSEPGPVSLFEKELLKTGVAERLALSYFDPLKSEWQSRLERAKRFRFYTHPAAPFINARDVLSHFSPSLMDEVEKVQTLGEVVEDFFAQWSRLYSLKKQCPPELLKRVLIYQQDQTKSPRDPHLYSEDFSLFGLRTTQDWFGRDFFELTAQFIINSAKAAEQTGYRVERSDAEADLIKRFSTKEVSADVFFRSLGIQKEEAIRLWQTAMLFSRYFQECGQSVLIDELPYRQFAEFAGTSIIIDEYLLPKELQLKNLDDFLAFEIYSRLACKPTSDLLDVPSEMRCVEEVEKSAPELISTIYSVRCAQIDERKIGSRLSLKQLWDWQTEEANWNVLCTVFPEIKSAKNASARFEILEQLSSPQRAAVDVWSRNKIVEGHPEWIEQEFAAAEVLDLNIAFLGSDARIDGLPIQDGAALRKALDNNLEDLRTYKEKGQSILYRITDVHLDTPKCVVPFQEAKEKGLIEIDPFLMTQYKSLCGKMPSLFLGDDGEWKPLSVVRDLVIREAFSDLFRAINLDEKIEKRETLEFYIAHRFHAFMKRALDSMQREKTLPNGLWNIEKKERTIARTSHEEWIMNEPFILQTDTWSPVYVPPTGEIVFFFVKEKAVSTGQLLDQIQLGKETLAADVQRCLADKLLATAMKKNAIVFPLRTKGEKNDDF